MKTLLQTLAGITVFIAWCLIVAVCISLVLGVPATIPFIVVTFVTSFVLAIILVEKDWL